jgi:hypothetical protein
MDISIVHHFVGTSTRGSRNNIFNVFERGQTENLLIDVVYAV